MERRHSLEAGLCVVLSNPVAVAQQLIDLGHEPFPLTVGRQFWFCGKRVYFLPNVISYMTKLVETRGLEALFWGMDGRIVTYIVEAFTLSRVTSWIDNNCPTLGGEPTPDDMLRREHQGIRSRLRSLIRESVVSVVAFAVSFPFCAQEIDGLQIYSTVFGSVSKIFKEEGLTGLYAGFAPALAAMLMHKWGFAGLRYLIDQTPIRRTDLLRGAVLGIAEGNLLNPTVQAYRNAALLTNLSGTRLARSVMPHAPLFTHWTDAYRYLKMQKGLYRGLTLFYRIHNGPVRVGPGPQLYADYKYFVW